MWRWPALSYILFTLKKFNRSIFITWQLYQPVSKGRRNLNSYYRQYHFFRKVDILYNVKPDIFPTRGHIIDPHAMQCLQHLCAHREKGTMQYLLSCNTSHTTFLQQHSLQLPDYHLLPHPHFSPYFFQRVPRSHKPSPGGSPNLETRLPTGLCFQWQRPVISRTGLFIFAWWHKSL